MLDRRSTSRTLLALVLALAPAGVVAQPPADADPTTPTTPPPTAPPAEPTAVDVDGKPVPGAESGRTDAPEGDGALRVIGRGALFVPKLVVAGVFAPIRGTLWANERYHLTERAYAVFWNDTGTVGLYPIAQLESGYGVNVGARFEHRDLLGGGERVKLHAGTGGRFNQIYSAKLRSGDRFGDRFALELDGQYELRPKDAFFGIGNGDVDRRSGVPAVEARFRERLARTAATADVRVVGDFHVRAAGSLADFTFERSTQGMAIDELYPMESLGGFEGFAHGYAELELRWDTRRGGVTKWDTPAVRAAGWLLSSYGGRVEPIGDAAAGRDPYWRFGLDVQRFIRIGHGPRVLAARLYGETVTGSLVDVPFTQLPRLGGKTLLRGYELDRFRDRVAAMGSLEYQWDLSRFVSASLFVDAGRVYESLDELEASGLRLGYGLGLEAHTARSFAFRASLASSIDGGIFLNLAFDPVYDLDPRVERR